MKIHEFRTEKERKSFFKKEKKCDKRTPKSAGLDQGVKKKFDKVIKQRGEKRKNKEYETKRLLSHSLQMSHSSQQAVRKALCTYVVCS